MTGASPATDEGLTAGSKGIRLTTPSANSINLSKVATNSLFQRRRSRLAAEAG
jgi:hypothetical protein